MRVSGSLNEGLRCLAEAVSEGVMLVREGCLAWANTRLAEMSGRADTSLEGLKVSALLREVDDGLPCPDGPNPVECRLLRTDGQRRAVICRRAWQGSDDGDCVWVLDDVTRARDVERELVRAGRELASANRELEAARQQAQHGRREREELLSIVSHELRTPLTVVSGYTRLLLSEDAGPLNDEQRRFLIESRKSSQRLGGFIANILDASRVARGSEVLEVGTGPLAPVIESVAGMMRPLFDERGLALELALDADVPVRFDALRVEQILTNLLGNAAKHVPSGGTVEVALRPAVCGRAGRSFVEVVVADDGPGVASHDRERVFEPYVQICEGERAEGLGLGLAICRRLVEAHGGEIHVAERPGGGAQFAFTLPQAGAAGMGDIGEV